MIAYPPLPIREDWAPSYLKARKGAVNRDFAFWFRDPQGMPRSGGARYHGAVDWFAPGGTAVRSPIDGTVVRVDASRGTTGQVFGGVVSILGPSCAYVMRHVDPHVRVGHRVAAGDLVADVTNWQDGGDHLHQEIFHSLVGNWYRHENAIDPAAIEWELVLGGESPPLPPPDGDTLRVGIQLPSGTTSSYASWPEVGHVFKNWIATDGPRSTSRVALAWRGSVWRYNPESPTTVLVTHADGRIQTVSAVGGGHKYIQDIAKTLVNRYL